MKRSRKEALAEALNKMPHSVRVGPWKYRLVQTDGPSKDDLWGECDSANHTIELFDCADIPSCKRLGSTVLHETLHAIWDAKNLPEEHEEVLVSILEVALVELFEDNAALIRWLLATIRAQHDDD